MKQKIYILLALLTMTVMGASAQAASYALTVAESDDSHGSIAFTVGGQSVGTAAAGATVTVTVTPEKGWVLKTLTAETYMTGGEMRTRTRGIGDNPPTVSILGDVTLTPVEGNPNQFTMTMPSANVRFLADYLIATEITLENSALQLKVNDEITTGASLTPAEAGSLVYKSSDEKVVKVENGVIKALAAGTATITVSFAGTDKYAAAQSKTIAVTVTLNESSVSVNNLPPDGSCLYVDDTFTLITTTTPEGLDATFILDDSGVLSLDENGVVTALKEGTASVTVKVGGDGVYAESSTTVTLTVTKVPTVITVEKATLELKVGDEIATGASLTPAEAGSLVYTSSNEQVAVVKDGKIKALAAGTATITVSFAGDDKYAAAESQTIALTVTLEGDSNNDGVVNVSDVVKAVSDGKTQAEIDAIVDIIMGRK